MKWINSETYDSKFERNQSKWNVWHKWFAWYPVKIGVIRTKDLKQRYIKAWLCMLR